VDIDGIRKASDSAPKHSHNYNINVNALQHPPHHHHHHHQQQQQQDEMRRKLAQWYQWRRRYGVLASVFITQQLCRPK